MESMLLDLIDEVKTYLEDKYKDKFTINSILSNDGDPDNPNMAYVYPESRMDEWFAVRIHYDENTGGRSFSDGCGFVLAEQEMLPMYREWIAEVIPDGKVIICIENETNVTRGDYSAGFDYEEFVEAESPYVMNITILAGSDLLADKTAFFEKISQSIAEKLDRKFFYRIHIAFTDENPGSLEVSKYKGASSFAFKRGPDKFIAFTKTFIIEEMSQSDIFKELEDEFSDDMELDPFDTDDDEDGEEDE